MIGTPLYQLSAPGQSHGWRTNQYLVEVMAQCRSAKSRGSPSAIILKTVQGEKSTDLKIKGLSALIVHTRPAASRSGSRCSLALVHKCRSSLEMGQISSAIFRRLYSFAKSGCRVSDTPWPTRRVLRSKASYRFECSALSVPPVSIVVSPAWNMNGMSRSRFLHVCWKDRRSSA